MDGNGEGIVDEVLRKGIAFRPSRRENRRLESNNNKSQQARI
jgi:hypothetical protein